MQSQCDDCGTIFPDEDVSHPCKGALAPFLINGEAPNGRDKEPDDAPALSTALPLKEAIRQAFRVILVATGPRDGFEPTIDRMAFHAAIREYLPADKHMKKIPPKSCSVLDLDYKMHAGRVAQRLVAQSLGSSVDVPGRWGQHELTKVRIDALYAYIRGLASQHGVDTGQLNSSPNC
jgi:hypothetical protein